MAQDPEAKKEDGGDDDLSITKKIVLNDKTEIPQFGLGTYIAERTNAQLGSGLGGTDRGDEDLKLINAIGCALKNGYIHIDSAQVYDTERLIMEGIKKGGKERKDIFVTSKLSPTVHTADDAKKWIDNSIKQLGGYIDLFLLHAPVTLNDGKDVKECYQVMMEYVKNGKIKSIGVSNFNVSHLSLFEQAGLLTPSVNQIEIHPMLREKEIVEYCNKKGIKIEAYSPMAKAKAFGKYKILGELGKKYNKSEAQIMIRWSLQQGYIALPKSTNEKRIKDNANVFDFKLDNDDMNKLDELAKENYRCSGWPVIETTVWKEEHFK